MDTQIQSRRRSRGFSLSLSINTPRLSRRQSLASSSLASPTSQAPLPTSPSRFKRVIKRISSFRIFPNRGSSSQSYQWPIVDTDYMYDDDIDVSYEGLLSLAARIGDAKPRNLPSEYKATLPRSIYRECTQAQIESQCAICLDKYEEHHEVMGIKECAHYFHSNCFETWLDMASNCPVCRRELTPADYKYDPNSVVTSSSSSTSSPTDVMGMGHSHLMSPTQLMDDYGLSYQDPIEE